MGVRLMTAIKEVSVRDELKRAEDAFYDAMFVEDEEKMLAANYAIVYYQSFDGHYCPEYPGF
jgi:hypothetical protein|tara:strand:+ start:168 stop:353 length:186 start_codon:yes stop_codon:yes gene_type:complete